MKSAHRVEFDYEPRPGCCSFDLCDREVKAAGLCGGHYAQMRKGNELRPLRPRNQTPPGGCQFERCDRPHHAQGYCQPHYKQFREGAEVRPLFQSRGGCQVEGCENPHEARGYCRSHYEQVRQGREVGEVRRYEFGRSCEVEGCDMPHRARGMCQAHYNHWSWESGHGRDSRRAASTRRRARLTEADIRVIRQKDLERLVARHDGMCARGCGRPWAHWDHIIPLSRGGRHSIGNLQPLCESCNTSKRDRLMVEWRAAA